MSGCRYCRNFDTGDDYEPFIENEVDFGFLGRMSIGAYISPKDFYRSSAGVELCYSMDTGDSCVVFKEINYCPICGRKLTMEEIKNGCDDI